MNDFTAGALEGLSYCKAVLDKHFDKRDEGPVVDAYAEIEETQLKLLGGLAQPFKDKVDLREGALVEI